MGRQITIQGYNEEDVKNHRKGHHQHSKYFKKESLKIAQELCYGSKVIEMIEDAETDQEIIAILHDARLGLIK